MISSLPRCEYEIAPAELALRYLCSGDRHFSHISTVQAKNFLHGAAVRNPRAGAGVMVRRSRHTLSGKQRRSNIRTSTASTFHAYVYRFVSIFTTFSQKIGIS